MPASQPEGQTPMSPLRAAGELVPLLRDRPHDLGEAQAQHRQIDARQAHAQPAEHAARRQSRRRARREEARAPSARRDACRERRGVRAEPEITGVAERDHPSASEQQLKARAEQREHENVGDDDQRVFMGDEGSAAAQAKSTAPTSDRARAAADGSALDTPESWRSLRRRRRPTEKALRPDDEHARHDQKFGDQGELRKRYRHAADVDGAQCDAQRLERPISRAATKAPRNRSQSADDRHHKGIGDDRRDPCRGSPARAEAAAPRRVRQGPRPSANTLVNSTRSLIPSAAVSDPIFGRRAHQHAEAGTRRAATTVRTSTSGPTAMSRRS